MALTSSKSRCSIASTRQSWARAKAMRVSVMLVSSGDPVQPAAEADQRASGAEDIPGAVQQPAPAAQRPGVGEMPDRLLDQRPQPRLEAVVGPLCLGELVLGAAVAGRGVPVGPGLGHAAEAAVQQAGDLDLVQDVLQACQDDELLLVAAARPAAGPGCRRLRSWRCRPRGRHGGTTVRPAAPTRPRQGGPPTTAVGCRPGPAGAVGAGGRGERPASQARWRAGRSGGSMPSGTRPPGRLREPAYGLVLVNVRTHRASRTPSVTTTGPLPSALAMLTDGSMSSRLREILPSDRPSRACPGLPANHSHPSSCSC